jgi:hypothetical protein
MPQGVLHGESPRRRNEAVERDVFGPRHWAQVIEAEMLVSGRGRNRVVPSVGRAILALSKPVRSDLHALGGRRLKRVTSGSSSLSNALPPVVTTFLI